MGMGKSAIFDIYKKNMRNFAGFLTFLFLVNLGFMVLGRERVSAAFVPTLSVSVDKTEASANGKSMLTYTNGARSFDFRFQVRRNLKSGYVATLSTETDDTALVNEENGGSTKINSIDHEENINNFTENSWGYKIRDEANFSPIPGTSAPKTLISSSSYGRSDEEKNIQVGIRIGNNLDSGKYTNKLIFSVVSNSYEPKTIMAKGYDFNDRIADLDSHQEHYGSYRYKDFAHHIKRSDTAPDESIQAKDISADDSDYSILAWYNSADQTVYFYSAEQKIFLNKDCSSMFVRFKNLTNIDFMRDLDMTEVTNMSSMFSDMASIESLDLSYFNTKNVTDMNFMFSNSKKLSSINFSGFDTRNVVNMRGMFYGLSKISNLDISMFDTSRVTNMNNMFSNMSSLTSLNISNFNTHNVTDMSSMFYGINNITSLDLTSFDTSKVTNMVNMFSSMSQLSDLNISSFDTSQVTDMSQMFSSVSKINSLDLSHFDTSKVTSMRYMFNNMGNLVNLNIGSFDTRNVENMSGMFGSVSKITNLDFLHFDTSKVKDMSYIFNGMNGLTNLNISSFNTGNVTNMTGMFWSCSKITNLNLSHFDTSKVKWMNNMFQEMAALTELNVSSFNTENVISMSSMFRDVSNLPVLNLANFKTSNVTDMSSMFYNMSKITSLDLSSFDTSKVRDMSYMLRGMSNVLDLNVSSFNTRNVVYMGDMFSYTYNLTELDLSSFDTSNVQTIDSMFYINSSDISKDKLEKIYVSNDFNTAKITNYSNVFGNRKKLRGGNGSFLADPNTADLSWLRVDRSGVQGYFTRKP